MSSSSQSNVILCNFQEFAKSSAPIPRTTEGAFSPPIIVGAIKASILSTRPASKNEEIDGKNRTLVYLFGTTKEGEPVAVRTPLLMPYFQVVEPTKDILANLDKREDVENLQSQDLWIYGLVKKCTKITTSHPGNVPKVRDWLKSNGFRALAADIPFHY